MTELTVEDAAAWEAWLDEHHETEHRGLARLLEEDEQASRRSPWGDAVEVALKFGWIDGLIGSIDEQRYRQRWTPRRPKSKWSLVNKQIALRHIAAGEMRPMRACGGRGGQGERRMGSRLHRAAADTDPRRSESAVEGEHGGEGAAATCEPHALESLARVARRHRGQDACAAPEHDRRRARDEGLRRRRRSRCAGQGVARPVGWQPM